MLTKPKCPSSLHGFPQVVPKSLVDIWDSLKWRGPLTRNLQEVSVEGGIKTGKKLKIRVLSRLFLEEVPTHDFVMKWQEKQNTLKQSFEVAQQRMQRSEVFKTLPTGTYICKWVTNVGNWNFGLCVPGRRDGGSTCLFSRAAPFRNWFLYCPAPLKPLIHILNDSIIFHPQPDTFPRRTIYYVYLEVKITGIKYCDDIRQQHFSQP